ncbi:MAG: OB-fold nucleic acid binding domain-containing protein, partial [Chloroflexota bacterium]
MTSRLDRISQQRQEKLDKLRALGVNPYPNRFHRTHTAQQAVELLKQKEEGKTQDDKVIVAGRIMAIRRMGKASFADLRDGSGKIQLLLHADQLDEKLQEVFKLLDIGDIIGVEGTLLRTKTGEATVKATSFSLLTKSLQPLPEKWHGLSDVEIRYRQRYVDLISNPPVQELFKVRSKVIAGIRQFLN